MGAKPHKSAMKPLRIRHHTARTVACLLAIGALAACSVQSPKRAATVPPAGKPSTSASQSPATSRPATSATPVATATLSPLPRDTHCKLPTYRYERRQDYSRSAIGVGVDLDRTFGPECPALAPDRNCAIPLRGNWSLMESKTGAILVEFFEDDAKKPARRVIFRPVSYHGSLASWTVAHYSPTKGTKVATMITLLLDDKGVEVARTPTQIMPIPTCDPSLIR
jgi:hypothetical protein